MESITYLRGVRGLDFRTLVMVGGGLVLNVMEGRGALQHPVGCWQKGMGDGPQEQ